VQPCGAGPGGAQGRGRTGHAPERSRLVETGLNFFTATGRAQAKSMGERLLHHVPELLAVARLLELVELLAREHEALIVHVARARPRNELFHHLPRRRLRLSRPGNAPGRCGAGWTRGSAVAMDRAAEAEADGRMGGWVDRRGGAPRASARSRGSSARRSSAHYNIFRNTLSPHNTFASPS